MEKRQSLLSNLTFWENVVSPFLLGIITVFFYAPSLHYPFQFDDIANITKRFYIRFDMPFTRWISSTRWVGESLNMLNFKLGRFDPFFYRMFNLIIHIAVGLVIYFLIKTLCRCWNNKPFFYENAHLIAFASSLLFLLHPVQTQTVSYVIQARLEGLASFFVLLTVLVFVSAFLATKQLTKIGLFLLGCVLLFLSSGTKEIAIVIPFLLILVDWFFVSQEQWAKFKTHFFAYAIFFCVFAAAAYFYLGWAMVKNILTFKPTTMCNRGSVLTPNPFDLITPFKFFISEFRVLLHYLVMFVWPFGISVEYDWKLATSFFDGDVIFSLFVLLMILGSAIYWAVHRIYSFLAFGLFWFFIAMAPRTTIIPAPELVCDYKTYLASVGVIFILGTALCWLFVTAVNVVKSAPSFLRKPATQSLILAVLFLPVGFAMMTRNKVWSSCVVFWEDNVKKAPNKARAHNNLGVSLCEANRPDEAIKEYLSAINLDKNYSDPWSNIAVAYSLKGDLDKAIESLKVAINICPNYPEAYNNLGSLLIKKQSYDEAERVLNVALKIRPWYGKAFYNLGRLYLDKQNNEQAWLYFKNAAMGDLDTPEGFFTYGQMSLRVQKYNDAVFAFEQIIKRGYTTPQIWFNLANSYFLAGNLQQAKKVYAQLIQENPLEPRYAYNLAEAFFTEKNYTGALEYFKKTTSLPKAIPQAYFRVAKCLELLQRTTEAKNFLQEILKQNPPEQFKVVVNNEITRISQEERVKNA